MPRRSPYTFDPRVGRYRHAATGRLVPRATIRSAIDAEIRALDGQARSLAEAYRTGEMSLGAWEREMRLLVKDTHLLNAAAAQGGWDQLTPADYGRVGATVREQYNYLDGLAGELAAGFQPVDGRFFQRVQLYTRAGRATYERTVGAEARAQGYTEERSILGYADHCGMCVGEADRGWQPLGALTPIGERTCLGNCACRFEFR